MGGCRRSNKWNLSLGGATGGLTWELGLEGRSTGSLPPGRREAGERHFWWQEQHRQGYRGGNTVPYTLLCTPQRAQRPDRFHSKRPAPGSQGGKEAEQGLGRVPVLNSVPLP